LNSRLGEWYDLELPQIHVGPNIAHDVQISLVKHDANWAGGLQIDSLKLTDQTLAKDTPNGKPTLASLVKNVSRNVSSFIFGS
jgi:hypothetical protein